VQNGQNTTPLTTSDNILVNLLEEGKSWIQGTAQLYTYYNYPEQFHSETIAKFNQTISSTATADKLFASKLVKDVLCETSAILIKKVMTSNVSAGFGFNI